MEKHNIIVIGGSAGGIDALKELIQRLPAGLPAAVFVVIHFPPAGVSYLADILNRRGSLPAHLAKDGETIQPGHIYVSEPDYHLVLRDGCVRLTRDARENHNRPAIDVLFRTAAQEYGEEVVGVVLSGLLNDGTAGLIEIKKYGGTAIVQDPATAFFRDMPQSAIMHVPGVDYVLPPSDIADTLIQLAGASEKEPAAPSQEQGRDPEMPEKKVSTAAFSEEVILAGNIVAQEAGERNEMPSIYSCPDCGGVLWEMDDNGFIRFRCHVGHAFTGETLLQQQSEMLENSIWYALRTMIDKARLARQLALTARERGHEISAQHFEAQARAAEHHSKVVRQLIDLGIETQNPDAAGQATAT